LTPPSFASTFLRPLVVRETVRPSSEISKSRRATRPRTTASAACTGSCSLVTLPASTIGTRASSMRMESASSTIAVTELRLHPVLDIGHELVAQVVEAGLVDRDVRDVAPVGLRRSSFVDASVTQPTDIPSRSVDRLHPEGVAAAR
jgi:hypothetical protein